MAGELSYANLHHIILISGSTSDSLTRADRPYMIRTLPTGAFELSAHTALFRDLGIKAVDALIVNCCACPSWLSLMENESSSFGFTVHSVVYDQTTTDFSTQISQLNSMVQSDLKQFGNGTVAVQTCALEEANSFTQVAQNYPTLLSVPWFGNDGVDQDPKVTTASDLAVHYYADTYGTPNSVYYKEVVTKLTAAIGPTCCDVYAVVAYDNVWLRH